MRLVSLKIYNFGKLQDFTYEFEPGINTIIEENGWGKTTLLSFIRVMLYGFKNEKAKAVKDRERNFWEPWNGGMYGGELIFENAGKSYLVQRVFGKKAAEDKFILRDNETMLESQDFSASLGEELFKLNLESFERTVFIGHDDCWTGASGDIASKIGNLTDDTDDVNNYEKVMRNLKDIENKYTDATVRGEVRKIKTEISEMQTFLRDNTDLETVLKGQYEKKETHAREAEKLEAERSALEAERKDVSEYQDIKSERDRYEALVSDAKLKEDKYKECREFFGEDIPSKADIDMVVATAGELNRTEGELRAILVPDKELIESREITETVITDLLNEVQRFREMSDKYESDESKLRYKEAELSGVPETKKKPVFGLLLVGVLFIAAFIGLAVQFDVFAIGAVTTHTLLVILVAVAGLLFVLLSFILGYRKKEDPKRKALVVEVAELQNMVTLRAEHKEKERQILETRLHALGIAFNIYTVDAELSRLKAQVESYRRYKEVKTRHEELQRQVDEFYSRYSFEKGFDLHIGLSEISKACARLEELSQEMLSSKKLRDDFEKTHDMAKINGIVFSGEKRNLLEIDNEYKSKSAEIEELKRIISSYETEIEKYQNQAEKKNEVEAELKAKNEELAAKSHILELSRLTQKYLEEAKTSLTAQYKNPIEAGFRKYYTAFTGNEGEAYKLDANTKLYINECNLDREISSLSSGKQDVAWNCLRMAFVDSMYVENKPFLVMDDPFINLDDNNLAGSKKFLEKVAEEYQVIYTTCSQARA